MKQLAFSFIDKCNTNEQRDLIIREFTNTINTVEHAEHILSFEDELKEAIHKSKLDKELLLLWVKEVLSLYSESKFIELHEKLKSTLEGNND